MNNLTTHDSQVEKLRKAGPRGDGQWAGFDEVYTRISRACDLMGWSRKAHLSDPHVATMADLGSGHEERMKRRLAWLRKYGWVV